MLPKGKGVRAASVQRGKGTRGKAALEEKGSHSERKKESPRHTYNTYIYMVICSAMAFPSRAFRALLKYFLPPFPSSLSPYPSAVVSSAVACSCVQLTTNDIIVNKLVHIWDLVRSRKEEARQRKKERRAARKQTLTAGGEPTLDGTDGTDGTALAPGAGILSHTKPVDTDADMDMDDGAEDEIGNGAEAGAGETEADAALANVDIFGDAGDDYKPREKGGSAGKVE